MIPDRSHTLAPADVHSPTPASNPGPVPTFAFISTPAPAPTHLPWLPPACSPHSSAPPHTRNWGLLISAGCNLAGCRAEVGGKVGVEAGEEVGATD